ncbi:hypothetical protein [Myceligenerans indicum]|uniref:Uncharacterized protein n=1 Tax=Myceligenerans indicum TaxID=2593663 RepID=A0ABS1LLY7_9MICO|nr:hypothetical protein [Myceligenerans indicum]MBL0887183.1 hypothetical protein [Myceligenerans indicum]
MPENDDTNFLSGALHGAADAMPGGETEEMHLQFGTVRDRIHRRRTTKLSGIGATALVVVGGLAVGATQLTAFDGGSALPAGPSSSRSATTPPSPEVSEPPPGYGWAPGDLYTDAGLFCGADAASITRSSGDSTIEFTSDPHRGEDATASITVAVHDPSRSGAASLPLEPSLVWVRDGKVVNLSRFFDPEPMPVEFDDSGTAQAELRLDTVDACDPPEGAQDQPSFEPVEYTGVLDAGAYQVLPVLWTSVGSGDYVSGGATTVTVTADGTLAGLAPAPGSYTTPADEPTGGADGSGESGGSADADGPDGGGSTPGPDCSAASTEDSSDFSFEPEPVARTAQALLDAALACDLPALQEAEEPGVTQLHRAAELSVAERFALPERGDPVYEKLATLLNGVGVVDPDTGNYVWPTVASPEYRQDPGAWDYAVEKGLATQAQADAWRAAGGTYYGWRLSIEPDGTWRTFLGPDPAAG